MQMTLYLNKSDNRTINKVISQVFTTSITPFKTLDIINPVVEIEYDSRIYTCNYAYIDTLHRYYYITNISLAKGNRMLIDLSVDVLAHLITNTGVKNIPVTVIRNENIGSNAVVDTKYPLNSNDNFIESRVFPVNPFTDTGNNYLIGINGG